MSTLAERIMVSYQNEAHLVHEFFFGHFPLHECFSDIFPYRNFFLVPPPITFLMVRPLKAKSINDTTKATTTTPPPLPPGLGLCYTDSTSFNIFGYNLVVRVFDGNQTLLNSRQHPSEPFNRMPIHV